MHMLILGAGYSGKEIAKTFLQKGFRVSGTTRSEEALETLQSIGLEPLVFDGQTLSDKAHAKLQTVTHLVQSISPAGDNGGTDVFLELIGHDLKAAMPKLQWIAYLSTVGVYGDHGGKWVNEEATPQPISKRSIERLATEHAWSRAASSADIPLSILRLSGIYGPGRNTFLNLERGTAKRLIKKDQVFNRIRVEDIASSVGFLSERKLAGIFNVTDNEPAPPQDLVTYAAELMAINPPVVQAFETATLTPMARSFYGENKRVSNAKIRDLGFSFQYPEYRKSLLQLWDSGKYLG